MTSIVAVSRSPVERELIQGYNTENGLRLLEEAQDSLDTLSRDPQELREGEWELHSRTYLALVLNTELYYQTTADRKWGSKLPQLLERWRSEHHRDNRMASEFHRLRSKYKELSWK
jgi:hypothetical protein